MTAERPTSVAPVSRYPTAVSGGQRRHRGSPYVGGRISETGPEFGHHGNLTFPQRPLGGKPDRENGFYATRRSMQLSRFHRERRPQHLPHYELSRMR